MSTNQNSHLKLPIYKQCVSLPSIQQAQAGLEGLQEKYKQILGSEWTWSDAINNTTTGETDAFMAKIYHYAILDKQESDQKPPLTLEQIQKMVDESPLLQECLMEEFDCVDTVTERTTVRFHEIANGEQFFDPESGGYFIKLSSTSALMLSADADENDEANDFSPLDKVLKLNSAEIVELNETITQRIVLNEDQNDMPVTGVLISLIQGIRAARTMFFCEAHATEALGLIKQSPQDWHEYSKKLILETYGDHLSALGLKKNSITLDALRDTKLDDEILQASSTDLVKKYVFNPWKGIRKKEK